MILVDTSVWIDHLRAGDEALAALLDENEVLMHPFVLGELACGNWREGQTTLELLGELPSATIATDEEVRGFIWRHKLMGRGIGYIDAHLMASTSLESDSQLWTRDKRLGVLAVEMGLCVDAEPRCHYRIHEPVADY